MTNQETLRYIRYLLLFLSLCIDERRGCVVPHSFSFPVAQVFPHSHWPGFSPHSPFLAVTKREREFQERRDAPSEGRTRDICTSHS